MIAFVCECAAPSCFETVRLGARDYDELRPGWVLADGHRQDA